eukprot:4853064-Pyramimonas_sp.AAC.1
MAPSRAPPKAQTTKFACALPTHVGTPFTRFVAEGRVSCATRSLRGLHSVGSVARALCFEGGAGRAMKRGGRS